MILSLSIKLDCLSIELKVGKYDSGIAWALDKSELKIPKIWSVSIKFDTL
jgi:hypothetical protein